MRSQLNYFKGFEENILKLNNSLLCFNGAAWTIVDIKMQRKFRSSSPSHSFSFIYNIFMFMHRDIT